MRRKRVIRPVPTRYLLAELTPEKMLGGTNHAGNLIYVVDAADSPAVLTEIGRLREISFRDAGGGTGESLDLDEGDLALDGYRQMIVWNPYERQIVGGDRFIISDGCWPKHLSTEHYFRFSEPFRQHYLPHTIELGRSFIQPRYQSGRGGVFSLDNLWDGMGAVVSRTPHAHYLFGKVTLYPSYEKEARRLLYAFMYRFFGAQDSLVSARTPLAFDFALEEYKNVFDGGNFQENLRILQKELKKRGESIPPLIKSYINLSPTMQVFGTVLNDDFGGVEETAILLTISDIYPHQLERHFVQKQKVL